MNPLDKCFRASVMLTNFSLQSRKELAEQKQRYSLELGFTFKIDFYMAYFDEKLCIPLFLEGLGWDKVLPT